MRTTAIKRVAWGVAAAWAATAPFSFAALGSTISSFYLSGTAQPYALGIYRDAAYVYGLMYSSGGLFLRSYTASGTPVGSITLGGAGAEPGHSQLGTGYMGAVDTYRVVHFDIATGSRIVSFSVPSGARAYDYIPGGAYVYVATNTALYVFATTGSLVRSFSLSSYVGGVAATRYFGDQAGEYFIVAPWSAGLPTCVYGGTSFVASFVVPGTTNGCVCGPGAPSQYGTTYWCNQYIAGALYAYQIDLGNTNVAVAPASVGRIKALFR